MTVENNKVLCTECKWCGTTDQLDTVVDPRPLPGTAADTWRICPRCRTPENCHPVCDEPGCTNLYTCGWPSPDGYRRTCGHHWKQNK